MFLLTMHPRYVGRRSRIVALEQLIDHIPSRGAVRFAIHQEAAEYMLRAAKP